MTPAEYANARIREGAICTTAWGRFQDYYGVEMRARYWLRPAFGYFQQHIEWQGRAGNVIENADSDNGWIGQWSKLLNFTYPVKKVE